MKRSWVYLLAGLLLVSVACREQPETYRPAAQEPLLQVGSREIREQQFMRDLQIYYPEYTTLQSVEQMQLKSRLVQQLIDRELLFGEAARLEIQISPDDLDEAMRELRGQATPEEFKRMIEAAGKTAEAWTEGLKLRLIIEKITRRILAPRVEISDKMLEKHYKEHRETFRRPLEVRVRQMLFETREEAAQIYQRLQDGGNFAALAREYSQSPDREAGGDLGYFSRGELPPEFDAVIFELSVGTVSEPVATPYGYHLFLVEDRRKAGIRPFAAVKDKIAEELYQQQETHLFQQWLENLRRETPISIDWDQLKSSGTATNQGSIE